MKTSSAILRYLRMTPRKVRLIADIVKGMNANEAEAQLVLNPRRAGKPLLKLLRSAMANAKNLKMDSDKLFVQSIRVDQAPMLKRRLPRARGMATPIEKKGSHVTLVLFEKENGKAGRFTIVRSKKKEKTKEPAPGRRKEKPADANKEKGFVKKIFTRRKKEEPIKV